MNTRLLPAPVLRSYLDALASYPRMARFRAPSGVEIYSGRRNGRPLSASGKSPTVLCLHGYCGGPQEVAVGVEVAAELGFAARAPLLKGHGGEPRELSPLRFEDWLGAVRPEFDEARSRGPVVLLGLSLGCLLAVELALSAPESVLQLVVMANPFWMRRPLPGSLLWLADWLGLPDFGYPTPESPGGVDDAARPRRYHVQPVRGAISLRHAALRLLPELSRITCPTLILHGARDEVCPVSNAWKFAELLGSEKKRVVVLPQAKHVLTLGPAERPVRDEIRDFLAAHVEGGPLVEGGNGRATTSLPASPLLL